MGTAHSGTTASARPAEREIVITRVFDAPRDRVFKAWTEPERVMRWWGPNGFTTPVCKIDLRPGGVFHNCMRSPEGRDFWSKGVYREIVAPERIVCTDFFSDAEGNLVQPTQYGLSPDWPEKEKRLVFTSAALDNEGNPLFEVLNTVTFAEQDGKTTQTPRARAVKTTAEGAPYLEGMEAGYVCSSRSS